MYVLNTWSQWGDDVAMEFFKTKKEAVDCMKTEYKEKIELFSNNPDNIYYKEHDNNHARLDTCEDVYFWRVKKVDI